MSKSTLKISTKKVDFYRKLLIVPYHFVTKTVVLSFMKRELEHTVNVILQSFQDRPTSLTFLDRSENERITVRTNLKVDLSILKNERYPLFVPKRYCILAQKFLGVQCYNRSMNFCE